MDLLYALSPILAVNALDFKMYKTYILNMKSIASTVARQNWADTIESAKSEPVTITDHGRPAVVMMNAELAELLLRTLEDSQDLQDAQRALADYRAGGKAYSLEEVAAELGLNIADVA